MAPTLVGRSSNEEIAAAVAGSCAAAGIFVLVLVFIICHLYKRKLVRLTREAEKASITTEKRPSTAKQQKKQSNETKRIAGHRHMAESKSHLTLPQPVIGLQLPPRLVIESEDSWNKETVSPISPAINSQDSWTTKKQQGRPKPEPLTLSRLMTSIPEDRSPFSDGSGSIPLHFQRASLLSPRSPRPSSVCTMSTLGRELLHDTMQEPDPSRYAVSPETSPIWERMKSRSSQGDSPQDQGSDEQVLLSPRSRMGLIWGQQESSTPARGLTHHRRLLSRI